MPGHDADKTFARRHQARGVRPDDLCAGAARREQHRHHILRRNVLGEHDQELYARGNGFQRRRLGERGGMNMTAVS